ncbi:hypothetical protein [Ruminococcus albus]|nr:hypothetical protein [Ruminococcus albus]
MAFSLALPASAAKHEDPAVAHITYADAPEGTVYTDILIKMTTDDESYTDFTQSPEVCKDGAEGGTSLGITADSEIAKYSEDGYISLSLHHKKALALCIYSDEELLKMASTKTESCDFIDLSINYGDFKAAYVDDEGNILGVTSASETAYSMDTPYGFSTNGDSLTFQRHGAHPRTISIMIAVSALVVISLPLIIGFIVSKHKKRLKASELAKEAQDEMK